MPDFYTFSTPESVLFGPFITVGDPVITKSVRLGSASTAGASYQGVLFRLVSRLVAALEQLHRTPPCDQLFVRLGGRIGIASRQCGKSRFHQTG